MLTGTHDRVTGAELGILDGAGIVREGFKDLFAHIASDQDSILNGNEVERAENVVQKRLAAGLAKHLRKVVRFRHHAGSLARRENDCFGRHNITPESFYCRVCYT